ncbi:hypothetical protein MP228_007887 [Amoeboaphelidium protococcarum]|nr:hypothetical protein MP228_007887 [Amoeboaphelidium protococcarum]
MANLEQTLFTETLTINLLGENVAVEMLVNGYWEVILDFSWRRDPFTSIIKSWSRRLLNGFLALFHGHSQRDANSFGTMTDEDVVHMSLQQKKNAITHAVRDLFVILGELIIANGRSLIDYAIWFRDRRGGDKSSYPLQLEQIACNCVIHGEILAPNIGWKDVVLPELK